MANTKIQDKAEVLRWFEEGKTYAWMVDEYKRKYNITTVHSLWANFRKREGLPQRITRDSQLIPWEVLPQHRWDHPIQMLRQEARLRDGRELTADYEHDLKLWKRGLEEKNQVVHYEPESEQGWFYVARRPGLDNDLIREPDSRAATRRRREARGDTVVEVPVHTPFEPIARRTERES